MLLVQLPPPFLQIIHHDLCNGCVEGVLRGCVWRGVCQEGGGGGVEGSVDTCVEGERRKEYVNRMY